MEAPGTELPQYLSQKIVRAAKITAFRQNGEPDMPDLVLGEIGEIVTLLPDWHAKHKPEVGGYYVQYADGYKSYSPAKAFEEGNTLLALGPIKREITDHKVMATDGLVIGVMDEPGHGGANHDYMIEAGEFPQMLRVKFQNGTIPENGINGVTHEALLAIVADRLRGFQRGAFATKANACALTHIEEALHWMQQRTLERMRRGVEGTHQV